jgi:uncharacterized protein YndB with AHSA1/START domain
MTDDLGQVRRAGDTVEIVFRRRLARPVEKVWAALTVPERIADWFAEASIDRLQPGGRMELYFTHASYRSLARIETVEPMRTIAWTWSDMDGSNPSLVRFDLEPDGDGCRLTLTHSGLSPKDGAGVGAGWHAHLQGLADAADGVATPDETLLAREAEVNQAYLDLAST